MDVEFRVTQFQHFKNASLYSGFHTDGKTTVSTESVETTISPKQRLHWLQMRKNSYVTELAQESLYNCLLGLTKQSTTDLVT